MKLEDFYRRVEDLTDEELVEQYEILKRVKARRERRDATARRLIESLDEPDEPEPG